MLWFGRDVFGRRSLLFHRSEDCKHFVLSSIASPEMKGLWTEIPATGIYCMDFSYEDKNMLMQYHIKHYPYISHPKHGDFKNIELLTSDSIIFNKTINKENSVWENFAISQGLFGVSVPFNNFNDSLPVSIGSVSALESASNDSANFAMLEQNATPEQHELRDQLINVLGEAVKVRVERQSHLCHNCITSALNRKRLDDIHNLHIKESSSECENEKSAANSSSLFSPENMTFSSSSAKSYISENLVEEDCNIEKNKNEKTIREDSGLSCSEIFVNPLDSDIRCGHARVAILFSGGIDSLVITALADRFVPPDEPIDLLNVAFEQKEKVDNRVKMKANNKKGNGTDNPKSNFNVPDRLTGKSGLQHLNANRKWNFVEINITLEELQVARNEHVKDLLYPLNTVLDDSIGCAIWFAARGKGVICNDDTGDAIPYTTSARVVLVGMGADEQLVGYSRHRAIYKTDGIEGLIQEIKMEIERISSRNLGRDDRIISDHGKEARFPFLDEIVVSFLNEIPIYQKANLDLPRGIGEKFLLRLAAQKLGLGSSSLLPKRAIQFGSRIAKIENRKEKASDVCERL